MSETANILTTTCLLGTLPAVGTFPLIKVNSYGGGITLLNAFMTANGLATAVAPELITMSTATGAQTAAATIGTLVGGGTSCEFAMASAAHLVIDTPYVTKDYWVALQVAADSGGTAQVTAYLNWVMGKG